MLRFAKLLVAGSLSLAHAVEESFCQLKCVFLLNEDNVRLGDCLILDFLKKITKKYLPNQ